MFSQLSRLEKYITQVLIAWFVTEAYHFWTDHSYKLHGPNSPLSSFKQTVGPDEPSLVEFGIHKKF